MPLTYTRVQRPRKSWTCFNVRTNKVRNHVPQFRQHQHGAYVALQSLNQTSSALATAQKQISTGYRVNDATDDGGAFAVAQKVRSDVSALTSVNQQLGNAQGLVTTTVSSLTSISERVHRAKALLVKIADDSISDDQRNQYITSFKSLVSGVANDVDGSTYNGQTLLGSASGALLARRRR